MVSVVLSHEWPPVTQKTVASLTKDGGEVQYRYYTPYYVRWALVVWQVAKKTGGDLGERDAENLSAWRRTLESKRVTPTDVQLPPAAAPCLFVRYVHCGKPMTPKFQGGTILIEDRP
jgi:hypothetical protein